jgi:hypothetical protein
VEALWNQEQNFRTEREKLDKFSTFGETAGSWERSSVPATMLSPGGLPGVDATAASQKQ